MADQIVGDTVKERFPLWLQVRRELSGLCTVRLEQQWATSLLQLMHELSDPIEAMDPRLFGQRCITFLDVAQDRFMEVDDDLLESAGQIAQWADPIEILIRVARDG